MIKQYIKSKRNNVTTWISRIYQGLLGFILDHIKLITHYTKKLPIKDFFSKYDQIQFPADLVTFTEETFMKNFIFLCSDRVTCSLPDFCFVEFMIWKWWIISFIPSLFPKS